ncbi:hypothetical protein NL676_020920 [Syzygium grande]|nr:hypothetical protein NL676_020920 [Syzygium grande]
MRERESRTEREKRVESPRAKEWPKTGLPTPGTNPKPDAADQRGSPTEKPPASLAYLGHGLKAAARELAHTESPSGPAHRLKCTGLRESHYTTRRSKSIDFRCRLYHPTPVDLRVSRSPTKANPMYGGRWVLSNHDAVYLWAAPEGPGPAGRISTFALTAPSPLVLSSVDPANQPADRSTPGRIR